MTPPSSNRDVLKQAIKKAFVEAIRDDPSIVQEAVSEALEELEGVRRPESAPRGQAPRHRRFYDIMEGWE